MYHVISIQDLTQVYQVSHPLIVVADLIDNQEDLIEVEVIQDDSLQLHIHL